MSNKVLIFIDVIAAKNELHIDSVIKYGLQPVYFVTENREGSNIYLKDTGEQIKLRNNFFSRLRQIRRYLKKESENIHHAEIHPGGRFSFIYLFLARHFRIKTICVERGDLLYYHRKGYDLFTRFSMWFCYRSADIIWYREPYMKPILSKLNKNLFFAHNAVKIRSDELNEIKERDITFLWLNRIIAERRSNWYVEVLRNPAFKNTLNYLVGMIDDTEYKKEQEYLIQNKPGNLVLEDFTNAPSRYYKRSKFFVLPSEVVFANNSLLEAMSYGVVPLVSDQPGAELIVDNGSNGYIFKHNLHAFEEAALKAFQLDHEKYFTLSVAALEKIKNEFSEEKYYTKITELYRLAEQ